MCAGIVGNFMTECGGQTLDLHPSLRTGSYYGLAQWSIKYYPGVIGRDTQGQCSFLYNNIDTIINKYGFKYKSGFNYNKFLNLKDERKAALAFAKCYERCSSASYSQRQRNAETAYEYFTKGIAK